MAERVLLLTTLLFTLAGTRLFYLIVNRHVYDFKAILSSWQSGFVSTAPVTAIPAGSSTS